MLVNTSSELFRPFSVIPSLFMLLRTLLSSPKKQTPCFHGLAYSLQITTRGGGTPIAAISGGGSPLWGSTLPL